MVNNNLQEFVKVCDSCGEIFVCSILEYRNGLRSIKCNVCFAIYYAVFNELNDFWYLELANMDHADVIYVSDW